jgi:flagellar protein FliO/FliZ
MHDFLSPMFGDTGATIAQFVITLVVVLLVILLVFWLIRMFTNGNLGAGQTRGRQPRLAVLDALPLDQRRRLILVRRDNVEHLILIGGPSDVVVEPGIQRAQQQTRRLEPIRQEPLRQDEPRPEAQRPEPPRPAPAPARPEPVQARSTSQSGRSIPAAPIEPVAARQPEPRRSEMAPIAEAQPVEASADVQARRASSLFDEAPETFDERSSDTSFAASVEPEASFEPASRRPAPSVAPERPAPEPRTGRGFPSFLSGNRPRHTPTTAEIPPESAPVPRPTTQQGPMEPIEGRSTGQRPRPYDPRPLLGSQQTPVAPSAALTAPVDPARVSPRRPIAPPAPPVVADADPFAGLDDEADRLARFEPIFDLGPETTSTEDAHLFGVSPRSNAPAVESPQPEDAPVEISEDFIEPPLPPQDPSDSESSSSVGDLEKEMARLLGEISNSRKS